MINGQVTHLSFFKGEVTHARLKSMVSDHPADITKQLASLVKDGFIVSSGVSRGTFYYFPDSPPSSAQVSEGDECSVHKELSSVHNASSSVHRSNVTLWDEVRKTQRAAPERVKEAILAFCEDEEKTLEEISVAIGREKETVRIHYLGELMESNRLELYYPDRPSHPRQAYRKKQN